MKRLTLAIIIAIFMLFTPVLSHVDNLVTPVFAGDDGGDN